MLEACQVSKHTLKMYWSVLGNTVMKVFITFKWNVILLILSAGADRKKTFKIWNTLQEYIQYN